MTDLDEILSMLAEAPDSQIDKTITPRIKELVGQQPDIVAVKLKAILDDCAYASLASDFSMMAMDAVWQKAQELAAVVP